MFLEQLEQRSLLAVLVWDGSVNNLWSNAANWSGDVAPTSGDDLVFPAGAGSLANQNDLPTGTRFNTILIQGSGYNITGAPIELAGGLTANNSAGSNTVALDLTLINAQSIVSANPGTTLTLSQPIHIGNLVGTTFFLGTTALNVDGAGVTNITGAIDGNGSVTKLGHGTLVLAGANTYQGLTDVRQGVVQVTHNTGLGNPTTGDTQIQAGASLHVSNNVTIGESLAIREGGVGFGNGTDGSTLGALRSVGGSNTITGNIDLAGGNNLIGVDGGSTLIVSGVVANALGATNRLIKTGDGTLRLSGTQDNVYRGETRVLKGTLELGKTAGRNAIGGPLIIGDNIGGDNGATVRLLASDQIPQLDVFDVTLLTVTLSSSGVLNLNGFSDTIGNLTLTTGTTYSADVMTGAGVLTLGGTLAVVAFQGSSGATPAATISGNLDLGTHFSGGVGGQGVGSSRRFQIVDTQIPNVATDLIISANITGPASTSITQTDGGTLRLTGNNSAWTGNYMVQGGGMIEIGSNSALGGGLFSPQNNALVMRAIGGSWTLPNTIALDSNVSFLGDDNVAGSENLTFTGPVTLSGDRTLLTMDPTQTVTMAGPIGEGIFANRILNKSGRGTLELTAANTYSGTTTLNNDGGTLVLRGAGSLQNLSGLTVGVGATLRIDNNNGGNMADRLNDAMPITLNGGRLHFVGSSTANSTEMLGPTTAGGSLASTIEMQNTSSGAFTSSLTANALGLGGDRTVNFVGNGVALSASGPNRFSIVNHPGNLDDAILLGGRVTNLAATAEFATLESSTEGLAVVAYPTAGYITDINQASATSNVKLTVPGTYTLTSSRTINSLILGPGVTLTGPGTTLTLNSSNLMFIGAGASTIAVDNINTNNGQLFVDTGHTATISGSVFSNNIQKAGAGKLILTGVNSTAGTINVNEGVLNIQRSTALGAPAGGTNVRPNATLEIEQTTFGTINLGLEPITIDGTGVISGLLGVGGLRNIAGNNSIAGNVSITSPSVNLLGLYGGFGGVGLANAGVPLVDVATGTTLTLTGDFAGGGELGKIGGGTLELAGAVQRNTDRNNRIFAGTLLLNNEPGVLASRGRYFIGTDVAGAPAATLRLGSSDDIIDDRRVEVLASGLFDLNGNTEVIGEGNLILHIAPSGAGDVNIGAGGTLYTNADIQIWTVGTGNPSGAQITGGTLALQVPGVVAAPGVRNWLINDGATGTDLVVISAIVDGTGLQSVGINKNGFGALELGGPAANTYTGTTTVNDGTLLLNKPSGVNAMSGPLTIGNNAVDSGFAGSDVVRLLQPNQLPDWLALVRVNVTGTFDLNGHNETIGVADAQSALDMQVGSSVTTGAGTLTLNGNLTNITDNGDEGVGLWTVLSPLTVSGNLNLGSITRTINTNSDSANLPVEVIISANISGTGGFIKVGNSTLLLSGNNAGLSGDVVRADGNFAVGSDNAFGTGRAVLNGIITTYGGKRTITTPVVFGANTIGFITAFNIAGTGVVGGGGNDLTFANTVDITAGSWFPSVPSASQLEFAGGLGETLGGVFFRKQGYGTMVLSSTVTLSGNLEIGEDAGGTGAGFVRSNGGAVILRDAGTLINGNVLVGYNGTLQIDNSGLALANRIGDTALVDLSGGILALVGKSGQPVEETMGQLRLRNNTSSSQVQALLPAAPNSSSVWRFSHYGLEDVNAGSNFQFVGRGAAISATGNNRIAFTTAPGLTDAIIPQAVLTGPGSIDFVTVTNATPAVTPFDNFVGALTSGPNFSTTLVGATATVNVKLAASEAVGAAQTINSLLLPTSGLVVSGAGPLTIDSGWLASRGATNTISTTGLVAGGTHSIVYVDGPGSTLNLSSNVSGASIMLAKGGAGMLNLSGTNTFAGTTRIADGVLRASSNGAFGTTANGVLVQYGGTVELNGVNIPAEQIQVAGYGETNRAAVGFRSVAGTANVWQGDVVLNHNRTAIETPAGSSLAIGSAATAGIVSSQGLNKLGTGTLQFAGTANNTFTTTSLVWQGTLELNKTAGINAIPLLNDNSEFFVGNYYGADNSVILRNLADNQIGDGSFRLRMMPSGRYDLNGRLETLRGRIGGGNNHDVLGLDIGSAGGGDVALGGGTLRIANDVAENGRIQVRIINGGLAIPAEIAGGTLQLGGTVAQNARILVDDSTALEDLIVSATINNGGIAPLNFIKNNNGRMVLTAVNNYTPLTIIEQGELVVRNAGALGTAAAATQVNSGTSLLLDGVSLSEPLSLNGVGFGGPGAIRNISGNNTLTGNITLAGTATIGVNAGQSLNVNAVISGGANGVTKLLPGVLRFSGATANTYTGTTSINEGILELNKTAGIDAIAGPLTIGNDNGIQGADVLRLLASDQINNGQQVQVTPAGHFDLNGLNETLGNAAQTGLNLFLAGTTGPLITTGAGTLTLAANVGIQTQLAGGAPNPVLTTPADVGARISGNLNLGGGAHNLNAGDSGATVRELQIDALISNGSLTSLGSGLVYLTNSANSYAGGTAITTGGGIIAGASNVLGTGNVTLGTNANNTVQIFASNFTGGVPANISLPNNILLNTVATNTTVLNLRGDDNLTLTGSITNQLNNNTIQGIMEAGATLTLAGTINLSNDATSRTLTLNNTTFGGGVNNTVVGGNVTISGQVLNGGTSTASAFIKGGVGLVTLSNNTNTYAGTTTVAAGNLRITANGALGGTIAEQQTFGVTSTGGGSFTITYNGQTTGALAYTGTTPPLATDVAAALNLLPSIARTNGLITVASSNPAGPTTTYTVTFGGALSGIDVTQISAINVTAPVTVSTAIATPVTGSGGTTVNNGATLQVVPGLAPTEPLTLNNNGFANLGAIRMIDLTPGTTESSTWAGNVNFNANQSWAGVDGGGANPDRLIFTGAIVSGGAALIVKTGLGDMEWGGNTDNGQVVFNAVSPNDDGLEIRQGTVYFNKPQVGGINYNAIVGGGRVTVGDGGGGANADRLVLIGSSLDQIGGAVPLTVGPSGLLTLAGAATESIPGTTTIQRLFGIAGSIDTAANSLILANTLDVANAGVTTGATPAATIAGNLQLNGANRSFNVADSFVLNPAEDLVISAVIANTAGSALQKDGYGTLALTSAQAYPGTTTVNSATLDFNASFTNGLNVVVGGTLIVRGAGVLGPGAVTVNSGGNLVLDNTASNVNRIADAATVTVNGGRLRLVGNAAGTTEVVGTFTINAGNDVGQHAVVEIDSTAGGVTVLQPTSLTRGGSAVATFVGIGADLGAATNSRINITGGTSPFAGGVLPWATITGPAGYDLVTDADAGPTTAPFVLGRVPAYSTDINLGGIVRLNGGTHTLTADRTVEALLLENGATVTGPFTLTVGTATAGFIAARTGSNVVSTVGSVATNPGVQYATREPLFLVETGATLNMSTNLNSSATLRKEGQGTLILSGDNDIAAGQQLTGATVINAGTLIVRNGDALGTEPGGTVTQHRRTALVFDATAGALAFGNKPMNLGGLGLNDDGSGAVQVIGAGGAIVGDGTTTFNWRVNPSIVHVAASSILDVNGVIANTNNNPLIKRGPGELIYRGNANTNTAAVSVNAGTLTLNKSGTNVAISGTTTINDLSNYDEAGAATIRYASTAGTNQIADANNVVVNAQGLYDLGVASDAVNALTVSGGNVTTAAGVLTIGAGNLLINGGSIAGNLVLNGNLTYTSGLSGPTQPATISGSLNLGGAQRTFTINDGFNVSDLVITAALSNGRLIKNGNGGLLLDNATNTFLAGINEVQRVVIAGATAGTSQFNISFNGKTTATITVGASDAATQASIQAALQALSNIGPTGATVSNPAAGQFDITFTGHLGEVDLLNQITTAVVTGPGTFTPSTVTAGAPGVRLDAGILAIGSPLSLGGARLHINASSQLLPVGGNKTLANNITINPNITVTLGGRRDFGGTDDLTLSGGITLIGPTTAQVVNLDVIDNQTEVAFTGIVSSGGDQLVPTKRGIGRFTLSGNNTFDVRDTITGSGGGTGQTDGIRIEGGTLRITNANALGVGNAANVHVRNDFTFGAVLEIDGTAGNINLPANRNIVLFYPDNYNAFGLYGRASNPTGVLRSVAGNNSIAGILDLRNIADNDNQGRIFLGVDAGTLTLTGTIFGTRNNAAADIRNNRDLLKVGAGTLELAGTNPNLITGNTAVLSGTLLLNKAPGVPALSGPLVVGDNIGAPNSDLAILAQSEQIVDGAAVTVTGSGRLLTNAAQAASLTNEVQQVQVGNAAPTGQFRLQFNGATTGDLAFGATPATIQAALNALATIGGVGGSVLVLGGSGQNQIFTVTFLGSLAGANQPQLKIVAGTTPYAAATLAVTTLTQGGIAGRETIGAPTLRMAPQGTGNIQLATGSTLSLNGDLTVDNYGALPLAAPTTAMITGGTLELRPQSGAGAIVNRNFNVTADGPAADDLVITSALTDGAHGTVGQLVKNTGAASRLVLTGVSQITGQTIANVGALQIENSSALGAILSDEVQSYVINNVLGNATGQYTITTDAGVTVNLDANATANEVQAALETLYGAGNVRVVSVINGNTNIQYSIRWLGTSAGINRAPVTLASVSLANATLGAVTTNVDGGSLANAQTTVNNTGALELDNVGTITNEQLVLNNTGIINNNLQPAWNNGAQALTGTGALRNLAGNNVWNGTVAGQGNVIINSNPTTIGVNTGTTLTIGSTTGVNVLAGGGSLLKNGSGTLELGGTVTNTYTGNTYMNEGTLRLNKQAAAIAINAGEVMIGDNFGGNDADILLYAATAGTDQIGNRVVRVTSTGLWNLNGVSETNNNGIVLDVGPTFSADIATGAGVLTNNNQFTAVNNAGTTVTSVPATTSGIYDLAAGTRNIEAREGNAPVELSIPGTIQVTGVFGINKTGRGTLAISGNNTYTGTTTINADSGTLLANTLATVATSNYVINAGSTLGGTGVINGTVTANGIGSNLTVGGIINPGPNAPAPGNTGILTVNNNVTFGAGSRFQVDINGTTVGANYDQLLIGGTTSTVTITGNAAPNVANTATIAGTTGNGFQPVNGVDAFKVLSKANTGGGPLTVGANAFLSLLPVAPLTSPATVSIGGKAYSTSYNVALGLNDGNDLVLQALAVNRVWDGRIDAGAINVSNNWTLPSNWVGDQAPFAGDIITFNDVGLANGKNAPVNDFPVGLAFGAINFGNTAGTYTVTGNAVTLNAPAGGVTSDNAADVAVNNNLNLPFLTAINPQFVTVKDGSTLNLGGAVTLVAAAPLTVTNGAGPDANGTAIFNGTINGASVLNINMAGANGDATFNGVIGGVTPLTSINVTTVDDLTFNANVVTTGNVTQTSGTGTTTLSGSTVGGALNIANETINLAGATNTVVGTATLTATVGGITDGNAAANNLTAPSLIATAATGINLDTTIANLTATITGAGNVSIDEADALSIVGLNIPNGNAVITAGGPITDAATAVISVSGNASFTAAVVTLGDTATDSFNADTIAFPGAGAVTVTEDSAASFGGTTTAASIVLNSLVSIGNVAAASVTTTGNATFNSPNVTLGAAAGDLISLGSLTFTAGTVAIQEDGAMDLLGASTATGAIVLTTVDVVATGQNLTIPAGASVTSTTSSVTLNAGDNATIAGNITSATTTTINVDFGDAETPAVIEAAAGSGGTVTITGVITTPLVGSGGGTFLNGNDDFDTFSFSPQTTTEFRVNGNAPVNTATGDVLALNVTGTTNPSLTVPGIIAPYNGPGSGAWSFTSPHLPVLFTNIEDTAAVGPFHLTYDNSGAPIGNLFVMRDGSATRLQLRDGSTAGPVVFQGLLSSILSLRVLGSAGNDIVTVDDVNTLPDFSGTVPGVTDNANLAGTPEFLFDGLGGSDTLVFNITGAMASQSYAIGNGTGAIGQEGEIQSTAAAITLQSYFQNVEAAQRTGIGANPLGVTVLGDSSANSLTFIANGTFTRALVPGYVPFDFSGNNYSTLTLSGQAGDDMLDLTSLGTAQTNNAPITLAGDANNDTIRVGTTAGSTGVVTLIGGLGNDLFELFNAANTVDGITAPIVVDGTDGSIGGNTDTLTIIDTGDLTADSVLISAVNPAASADYAVEGINNVPGNDVVLRSVDVLNYTGTQGNDLLDTRLVNTTPPHDLSIVTVNGWLGGDQFLLFTSDQGGGTGAGVTPTGTTSGVAIVNLNGDAPGNPNGLDGNDIFGQTAPGIVGTGAGNVGILVPDTVRGIRPSASTGININGGEPTGPAVPTMDTVGDVLNLDVSGLPGGASLILPTLGGVVAATGFQPLSFTQIEDINLIINNQLINVQMGDVFVRGTAGADLIQFMRAGTIADPFRTRARVNTLVVDFTLTGKTVTYAGGSNDYITQANLTVPAETYGEDGDDYISGAMANDFLVGGLGHDRINASGGDNILWGDDAPSVAVPVPQDLAIGGNDILSGLSGNDVFYAGGGDDQVSAGGGNDYVHGGQGNDTLDGHEGDDRIYGGLGDDILGGSAGNDLLSAGAGNDRLIGGTGNDILFGGTGTDDLTGQEGNDLLVTGSVANESSSWTSAPNTTTFNAATYANVSDNDAALLTLLAQWGSVSDRSSIGAITHDGVDDDVLGWLGDDDFCWETADILDDLPSTTPTDFNTFGMGNDDRFGPTS